MFEIIEPFGSLAKIKHRLGLDYPVILKIFFWILLWFISFVKMDSTVPYSL